MRCLNQEIQLGGILWGNKVVVQLGQRAMKKRHESLGLNLISALKLTRFPPPLQIQLPSPHSAIWGDDDDENYLAYRILVRLAYPNYVHSAISKLKNATINKRPKIHLPAANTFFIPANQGDCPCTSEVEKKRKISLPYERHRQ